MAYELVNVGAFDNDPSADKLRLAFQKLNTLVAGVNSGDVLAADELTTAILAILADPTNGPILATAIIDEVGGDAIAATMLADMSAGERTAWLTSMFSTEVLDFATAADIWAGSSDELVQPSALTLAQAPVTVTASAGVLTINGANGLNFEHTQTANLTAVNFSNLLPGMPYSIRFVQGGSGSYTITFGSYQKVGLPASFAAAVGAIAKVTAENRGTTGTPVYEVTMGGATHV